MRDTLAILALAFILAAAVTLGVRACAVTRRRVRQWKLELESTVVWP